MAQAIHAAVNLALDHPEQMAVTPNTIVLAVADERDLLEWSDRFAGAHPDAPRSLFVEPDLGDEHTAMACICDGRLFANLPLAGREVAMSG